MIQYIDVDSCDKDQLESTNRQMKIYIEDRAYSNWSFLDPEYNTEVTNHPYLDQISPITHKLFSRDIFTVTLDSMTNLPTVNMTHSYIKTCSAIAGVLLLEQNKTFGRTANKKRLLYKCIPDDKHLPAFLIPYEVKIGFSKVQTNKYVIFKYDSWIDQHPHGQLVETLGDVTDLEVFYEYQLYCKSLHVSIAEFTNKTRDILNKKSTDEYVQQIMSNPLYDIEDRSGQNVITIDPKNSVDFDDGLSIELLSDGNWKVSVYIANVFLWLETLGLWNSFSKRVATIYLPDRRRPMLPTILSDTLCSLQQDRPRFAIAMDLIVDSSGSIQEANYKNVLICVKRNYHYEDPKMIAHDKMYQSLFDLSKQMDKTVKSSNDVVAHWMVQMNTQCGNMMASRKIGIFRAAKFEATEVRTASKFEPVDSAIIPEPASKVESDNPNLSDDAKRVIHSWNNTVGQYVLFAEDAIMEHECMTMIASKVNGKYKEKKVMKSYIHITSPIRRLVDLLNQMIMFRHMVISEEANRFMEDWLGQLDYINIVMRSIRKIQTDCDLLARCTHSPHIMNEIHDGIVFDKIVRNDGTFSYVVYLEDLKMLSRITTHVDLPDKSSAQFKLYLFHDEDNVKKKIRLQLIQINIEFSV